MVSKVYLSRCGSGPDGVIGDAFTPLVNVRNVLKMSAE